MTFVVIGIIKRDLPGSPVRIAPLCEDVAALANAGANIIAVDGTDRQRPSTTADLLLAIHATGRLVMADCAKASGGVARQALEFDIPARRFRNTRARHRPPDQTPISR